MDVINLLAVLRRAKGRLVVVTNEFGVVQGLVTPLDVLEAIAGEFPDEDETPDIVVEDASWLVKGGADLHSLEQALNCDDLVSPTADFATLAGFLLSHYGQMPAVGETVELNRLRFEVVAVSEYRIELVRITKVEPHDEEHK
ncbi:Hemolysin C [compost metagenome]